MKKIMYLAAALFLQAAPAAAEEIGNMNDFAFPDSALNPYGPVNTDPAGGVREGIDTAIVTQMQATSTGNTIVSGVTGFNSIGEGAFQNASGLINLVQNSGNGVIIQNSMTVNLNMQ